MSIFTALDGTLKNSTSYPLPKLSVGSRKPNSIAFSPNRDYVITANYGSSDVTVFNVDSPSNDYALVNKTSYPLPYNLVIPSLPASIAISSDGQLVVTANVLTNDVTVFELISGQLANPVSYPLANDATNPSSVQFSPDDLYVLVADGGSNTITVFNVTQGGVLEKQATYFLPPGTSNPQGLAFTPDGAYVATANAGSNDISVFTVKSGTLSNPTTSSLPTESREPRSLVFVPLANSSLLLATANSGSNDVTIYLFQAGKLSNARSYPLPSGAVSPQSIASSPDGSQLATANTDSSTITVFTTTDGMLDQGTIYRLPAHSKACAAVAFYPSHKSKGVVATANSNSNDVSVLVVGVPGAGDGSSLPLGAIIGTTVGIPLALSFLAATAGIGAWLFYKYRFRYTGIGHVYFEAGGVLEDSLVTESL